MGADMLVACFSEPMDIEFKPDWKAGHDFIDQEAKNWEKKGLPYNLDHFDSVEDAVEHCHNALEEVQAGYENNRRDLTCLEFPPYRVYLTGGMSWGEEPSDIFRSIEDLNEILDVCGFNEVTDYSKIINKILKTKELLPLLLGLDDDFDKMIAEKLKGK